MIFLYRFADNFFNLTYCITLHFPSGCLFTGGFLGTGLTFPFAGLEAAVLIDFFAGVFATALGEVVFFAFVELLVLVTDTFLATMFFLTGGLVGFF